MTDSLKQNNNAWSVTLCFMIAAASIMLPDFASAATTSYTGTTGTSAISTVICNITKALQGPVARGVAAFGVIFLGFSLFLGKISWGTSLALGIGLGAIFGAQKIVNLMSGGSTTCGT